jgi:hypothetical protein
MRIYPPAAMLNCAYDLPQPIREAVPLLNTEHRNLRRFDKRARVVAKQVTFSRVSRSLLIVAAEWYA